MASGTSKHWGYIDKANSSCYGCGDFTTVAQHRTITPLLRSTYFHYFDCKTGDQDKSWVPHICCKLCYSGLTVWLNGKEAAFYFAVSMVWRKPRSHADDCYFCLTNITGFNASFRKKRSNIPTFPQLWDLFRTQMISLSLHPQQKRIFFIRWRHAFRERFCQVGLFWRQCLCLFKSKWQWAPLDHARRPEWSCPWFVFI